MNFLQASGEERTPEEYWVDQNGKDIAQLWLIKNSFQIVIELVEVSLRAWKPLLHLNTASTEMAQKSSCK